MHHRTSGGSSETEVKEFAVIPRRRWFTCAVTTVTPVADDKGRFEIGDIGVLPDVHPHLLAISDGEPGDKAGLKPGDVLTAIDGRWTTSITDVYAAAATAAPDRDIPVVILREGHEQNRVRHGHTHGHDGAHEGLHVDGRPRGHEHQHDARQDRRYRGDDDQREAAPGTREQP